MQKYVRAGSDRFRVPTYKQIRTAASVAVLLVVNFCRKLWYNIQ